jgi:hypothetical protein
MNSPHADVAELADAQVSEACDGDIVEVQVLSSAPIPDYKSERMVGSHIWDRLQRSLFILEPPLHTRV